MKRFLSAVLAALLLVTMILPANAASDVSGATIRLMETEGTVTVKDAAGKAKTTRNDMRLYNGYTVETSAKSSAFIGLDDTKAIKLDHNSRVEIRKNGKQLEVALLAGQVYFNVDKPLASDETLNISTATMVTGVRGSFGWQNLLGMGMIHGSGNLLCIDPRTGETRETHVGNGEGVFLGVAGAGASTNAALEEIGFSQAPLTNEQVPAVAAEMIAVDPNKQEQIRSDVPALDVDAIVGGASEKRAEENAAEDIAQRQSDAAIAAQEQAIGTAARVEYVDPAAAPVAGGETGRGADTGGGSGGGSSGGDNPSNSAALMAELQNGSATLNADGWTISYTGVTVGAGQTLNITGTGTVSMPNLIIEAGGVVNVSAGATLAVSGDELVQRGTLTNNGTVQSAANQALCPGGTIVNNGTFVNSGVLSIAPGASFTGGTVSNTGTILYPSEGGFSPGACDGVVIRY